jgi:hypothetical protein
MKNIVLFFLMTLLLFSCTIEKRRYFKGYHVALRQAQGPPIRQAQGPGKRESGEEEKSESAQERQSEAQQSAASNASNNEKPQRGEIIIAREIEIEKDRSHVNEAPKPQRGEMLMGGDNARTGDIELSTDDVVMVDENVITDNHTNTENGLADEKLVQPKLDNNVKSSKGGDVVDVGRVIFGMLSIVSFALALLFFGSAIFAIDSLVMTVLLLIGGGFALAGLVFLVIFALIKRNQSAKGQISGSVNETVPGEKKPKSVLGMVIAFLISTALTVYLGVLIAGSESLMGWIFFATFFSVFSTLAIAFAIAAIVRWIRRNRYLKMQNATPPKDYKE